MVWNLLSLAVAIGKQGDAMPHIRRMTVCVITGFVLFFSQAGATDFYSQSTHGSHWQGSVGIGNYKVWMTVHPTYLDIEEDLELTATGQSPGGDTNSLEILGETSVMPWGSVMTGAMIWDGNRLLKAKLKATAEAVKQYEDVVKRDSAPPPVPRDPVMIRKMNPRDGVSFWVQIYPVRWGEYRKVRLRYLVPLSLSGSGMAWKPPLAAFVRANRDGEHEVELRGAEGVQDINLSVNGAPPSPISIASPLRLKRGNFVNWILSPIRGGSSLATTHIAEGEMKGGYALGWGSMPSTSTVAESLLALGRSVTAELRDVDGAVVFQGNFPLEPGLYRPSFLLNIRSEKRLDPKITWTMLGETGNALVQLKDETDGASEEDTALAKLWAGDENRKSTAGASKFPSPYFGIVDDVYSLLALPDDGVNPGTQELLSQRGVPFLSKSEIFPAEPTKDTLSSPVPDPNAPATLGRTGHSPAGRLMVEQIGGALRVTWPRQAVKSLDLVICDARGRVVKRLRLAGANSVEPWTWDLHDALGDRIRPGIYFLLLRIDGSVYRATVRIGQ